MTTRTWSRFDLLVALGAPPAGAAAGLLHAPLGPAAAAAIAFVLTAYGAFCHRRARARAFAAAVVSAIGVGLLFGPSPQPLALWLIDAAAIVLLVEVLGSASERLRRMAITDPLTGLLNREGLWEAAARARSLGGRLGRPVSVVHIDLDHFKAINDSRGHAEGDRVLKACAELWQGELRAHDLVARLGGDEFVLVLPGSDLEAAERLAARLRRQSPTPWSHGAAELLSGEDLDACLARADRALYAAKAGRQRRRLAAPPRAFPPVRNRRRAEPSACRP